MSRIIDDELVEPVVQTLLGVIDVEGGPTSEQLAVLRALVHGLWERPDLDLDSMTPFAADQAAYAAQPEDQRNRLRELIVLLELCRHPASDEQVKRADEVRRRSARARPRPPHRAHARAPRRRC